MANKKGIKVAYKSDQKVAYKFAKKECSQILWICFD